MAFIGGEHRSTAQWAVIIQDRRRALATLVRRAFHSGNQVARRSFAAAVGDLDVHNAQVVALIRYWGRMPFFMHFIDDPLMPFDRPHFYNYVFEDDYQICEEQEVMMLKWTTLAMNIEINWHTDVAWIQWRNAISIDELRRCSRVMQFTSMLLVEQCGDANYVLEYLSKKLQFTLAIGAGRSGRLAKLQPLIFENIGSFLFGVKQDWISYPIFDFNVDCPVLPTDIDHYWHDELSVLWVDHLHEEFWRLRVAVIGFAKQQDFLRSEVDKMDAKLMRLLRLSRDLAWNF
jgi:hypothetical protein